MVKMPFCALLREIRVRKPLPKVKISISDAYFSDAQTMADFFNRIGHKRTLAFHPWPRQNNVLYV
jgi:hypothetical protein